MILFCYRKRYTPEKFKHIYRYIYVVVEILLIFLISANGTCIFWNNEPNVVSFYNDLQIREEVVEFPPGATIVSRSVLQF